MSESDRVQPIKIEHIPISKVVQPHIIDTLMTSHLSPGATQVVAALTLIERKINLNKVKIE